MARPPSGPSQPAPAVDRPAPAPTRQAQNCAEVITRPCMAGSWSSNLSPETSTRSCRAASRSHSNGSPGSGACNAVWPGASAGAPPANTMACWAEEVLHLDVGHRLAGFTHRRLIAPPWGMVASAGFRPAWGRTTPPEGRPTAAMAWHGGAAQPAADNYLERSAKSIVSGWPGRRCGVELQPKCRDDFENGCELGISGGRQCHRAPPAKRRPRQGCAAHSCRTRPHRRARHPGLLPGRAARVRGMCAVACSSHSARSSYRADGVEPHASTFKPCLSTTARSLSAMPLGRLVPASHFCTVDSLVFR